jgi:hypothetical protein
MERDRWSVNGQIEYLLRHALTQRGVKLKPAEESRDDDKG